MFSASSILSPATSPSYHSRVSSLSSIRNSRTEPSASPPSSGSEVFIRSLELVHQDSVTSRRQWDPSRIERLASLQLDAFSFSYERQSLLSSPVSSDVSPRSALPMHIAQEDTSSFRNSSASSIKQPPIHQNCNHDYSLLPCSQGQSHSQTGSSPIGLSARYQEGGSRAAPDTARSTASKHSRRSKLLVLNSLIRTVQRSSSFRGRKRRADVNEKGWILTRLDSLHEQWDESRSRFSKGGK